MSCPGHASLGVHSAETWKTDAKRTSITSLIELFNLEASAALKKAHKLSQSVLYPKSIEKSIEKTCLKLATAVFCESTRDALGYSFTPITSTSHNGWEQQTSSQRF